MPRQDEFGLIRLLTASRGHGISEGTEKKEEEGTGVVVGIGDDAAVLDGRTGFQWVASCDTMVRDVHFKEETMRYADIGYKAMASNISDMAAMGAVPRFALVALTVPREETEEALRELYDGLYECAGRYGVAVVGGDTTSTPGGLMISITVLGEVEQGRAQLRSAARPGDRVFITGPLGGSAAGLHLLLSRECSAYERSGLSEGERWLVEAHQRPVPQVEAGRLLSTSGLGHALNDISDGLASEAWEIAEASGCLIELEEGKLPHAEALVRYAGEKGLDPLELMLYGGEDYQLIGTVAGENEGRLLQLMVEAGLECYMIGQVAQAPAVAGPGVVMRKKDGSRVALGKRGYNHFGGAEAPHHD